MRDRALSQSDESSAIVLIVEDDPDIVEILRLYLAGSGYVVLSASDGVEDLEALGRERVDLALVDLMMPNVNGFEFISSARAMTDVPIIVVSARGNPADKALGLDLGADGYITKPFDPSEVLAYVRAVLRRCRNGLSASLRSEDEPSTSPGILSCGGLELDREAFVLRKRGRVVPPYRLRDQDRHETDVRTGKNLHQGSTLRGRVWHLDRGELRERHGAHLEHQSQDRG